MTQMEARSVVIEQLKNLDLPDVFVIIDDATEERESCFVFYWTLKSARDGGPPLAGNAPFIVDRESGRAFITGTALPVSDYIVAFERFGDPSAAFGDVSCTVTITGWREGAQKISATKRLCATARFTLVPAKHAIDSVLDGELVEVTSLVPKVADSLATDLDELGFEVTLRTINSEQSDGGNQIQR